MWDAHIHLPGAMMVFGSTALAMLSTMPRAMTYPWMRGCLVGVFGQIGGTLISVYVIWFLGSSLGWGSGLLTWVAMGMLSAIALRTTSSVFPLMLLIALPLMYAGLAWSIAARL